MNISNNVKSVFRSFYDGDLYLDVWRKWKGIGGHYFIVVAIVISILKTVSFAVATSNFDSVRLSNLIRSDVLEAGGLTSENSVNAYLDDLANWPEIKIIEGLVYSDAKMPYIVKNPETQKDIFIIDTSGKYKTLADSDALVLLTKSKLIVANDNAPEASYNISDIFKEASVSEDNINNILYILSRFPAIKIEKCSLKIPEPIEQPYYIKDNNDNMIVTIDASGDGGLKESILVLLKDGITINDPVTGKSQIYDYCDINLDNIESGIATYSDELKKAVLTKYIIVVLLYFFITTVGIVFIQTVFYSLVCMLFLNLAKVKGVSYEKTFRLTLIAITPMLIFSMVISQTQHSYGPVLNFLMATIYIFFVVNNLGKMERK